MYNTFCLNRQSFLVQNLSGVLIMNKKKYAILLLVLLSCVTILTGCNLFSTNNYVALSSIVATSGNISVTREDLLNAYYSSGYYYNYVYGYTQEEAIRMTIDDLIDQRYLLDYIDSNEKYALNNDNYNKAIYDTYSYMNSRLQTVVNEVRSEFGLTVEEVATDEETEEPEFAPQERYQTKFDYVNGKVIYENYTSSDEDDEETEFYGNFLSVDSAKQYTIDNYIVTNHIKGSSSHFKSLVQDRFMTTLKQEQAGYGYKDLSDSAVLKREIETIFDGNIDSQKIARFQYIVQRENGFVFDEGENNYVITQDLLQDIVDEYKTIYASNMAEYRSSSQQNRSSYFTNVANSSKRANYVYYGNPDEETLITCTHILIKLSDEQLSQIEDLEANKLYYGEKLERAKSAITSWANTFAYERSLTTGEVIDEVGISVETLFDNVKNDVNRQSSLEDKINQFNDYLYRYNVDTGIINAKYDYVVGTNNSAMVDSFTNLVRDLYDNGNGTVGSIGYCYEENDNYSGYHIVMYTGTLQNLYSSLSDLQSLTIQNVYQVLSSEKTSLSYNQTMFELMFDTVVQDNYEEYATSIVETQKSGASINYNVGNFSDLY